MKRKETLVKPVETFLENKRIQSFGHCLRRAYVCPRYQSRIDSGVNGGNTAVRYFGHVVREASGMENGLMCTRMKEKGRERRPT